MLHTHVLEAIKGLIKMAAHVEAQFTSSEVVLLRQPNTLAFVQGKELGLGLLNIDEK